MISEGGFLEKLKNTEDLLLQRKEGITLHELFLLLGSDSQLFGLFLLVLPFLQPIPLVGISTPLGIILALLSLSLARKKTFLMPRRFQNLKLPSKIVRSSFSYAYRFLKKIKGKSDKKQWSGFAQIFGYLMCIQGLLLSLPLPIPFSNAIPAWSIFVSVLALMLQKKRLFLLSCFLHFLSFAFFTLILWGGKKGLEEVIFYGKSFL